MIGRDQLNATPGLPIKDSEPVFQEPWQAQAFAMTVRLHEAGHFDWTEWAEKLGTEISRAGPHDSADNYYLHWLSALENLLSEKNIVSRPDHLDRKAAWDRAARATPHGVPIELSAENQDSN